MPSYENLPKSADAILEERRAEIEARLLRVSRQTRSILIVFPIMLRAIVDAATAGNVRCKQCLNDIWPYIKLK